MKRRGFLVSAVGTTAAAGSVGAAQDRRPETKLAGLTLSELRKRFHDELFEGFLPFWDRYGIDHERGGFFHQLGYDGARHGSEKFLWFQGRGIWVYSFLYNRFGKDCRHLEVARKAKEFVLRHAPQPDGWWAESLADDGRVLRPFQGDVYGMLFAAEGLQEYAWAAGDEEAQRLAVELVQKLFRHMNQPEFRFMGTGVPGRRTQGLWMVSLRIATQMLRRWKKAEIEAIADASLDAIMNRHFNPAIGLNNEMLNFDFSRPPEEASKCLVGHSIESLWMVLDEAQRRDDAALAGTAIARIRRHIEIGWDDVYGGIVQSVNVDGGGYEWPPERPVGTSLEFRGVGEYFYLKPLWALNEVLVATLAVFERTGAAWAAEWFSRAQDLIDEKYSRWKRERRYGHLLFADRRLTWQPQVSRQDNYHPPRQLMLNLLALERLAPDVASAAH